MGTSFNTDAILSYSTGFEQKEPLNAESKQVQNIQMVSPEALEENCSVQETVLQNTNTANNNKETSSKDILKGYSISQIREFISKGYDLSKEKLDKMSDEEIQEFVNNKINKLKNDKIIKKIINKYPSYENIIIKAFIESGLYEASYIRAVEDAFAKMPTEENQQQEKLADIYKHLMMNYAGFNNEMALNEYSTNKPSLSEILQLSDNKNIDDIDKLKEYLEKIKDPQDRLKEFLSIINTNNKLSSDEIEIIQEFLKKYSTILASDEITGNTAEMMLVNIVDSEYKKRNIIVNMDKSGWSQAEIDAIAESNKDGKRTEIVIAEICAKYGVEEFRAKEIIEKIQENPSYFNECTSNEQEFYNEYKLQCKGTSTIDMAIAMSSLNEEEKISGIHNNNDVIYTHLGETAYRDVITGVYNYIQELQNQGIELNISYEQFAELMNAATNGNYDVVMNDILRGDGVLTELNMEPVQPRSGGEEGASAYNSETGMFNVPDGDPYAAGENLAQQLNQLYTPSLEDTLPKPVQENPSVSIPNEPSIITSYKEWQVYYSSGNTTKALKNIVSNNVVVTSQAVVNKVIEQFKNFDKTIQSNILAAANGDWFGKLLNNTKVSALKGIFASGGFIGGIYRIQQANDRIKEEEKKTVS